MSYTRIKLKETDHYILYNDKGRSKYEGCQCFGNCGCAESFESIPYSYYSVRRKGKKIKTTFHNTIEEAEERCAYLDRLAKGVKR